MDGRRTPIQPYASYATGANEMSPLDMAAGAQTLANNGLHKDPYYVERIEGPEGLIYEHRDDGVEVFTPEVANRITTILKGVMVSGTARRSALEGRESAGKTGTQDNNTNAWMVGYTPELTTAVWVGHPDLYLPMNNIPEFAAAGVPRVQGGTFPARIWKATMDGALAGQPPTRFAVPGPNPRPSSQLFLPGVDCVVRGVAITDLWSSLMGWTTTSVPLDGEDPLSPPDDATTTSYPWSLFDPGSDLPEDIAALTTTVPRGQVDPTWPVPTIDPLMYSVVPCPA
jgi:penicillin-binding protein 1A